MTLFIEEQAKLHPSMQPQDVIKMCFQEAYGAEHLLTDIEKVEAYFMAEFNSCEETDAPLAEFIAPQVCRVNLGVWKKQQRLPGELFELFVQSAQEKIPNGNELFFAYVNEWKTFLEGSTLSFSANDLDQFFQEYLANCGGEPKPLHHSQNYRNNEKPAYRIISGVQCQQFK